MIQLQSPEPVSINSLINLKIRELDDFKVGQIYKMKAGYHTKHPYFVEIIDVGESFVVTNIPGHHCLVIKTIDGFKYHFPRMTYMRVKEKVGHLIKNQSGLVKFDYDRYTPEKYFAQKFKNATVTELIIAINQMEVNKNFDWARPLREQLQILKKKK